MVALSGPGWRLAPSLVAAVQEIDEVYPNRDRSSDGSIGDQAHASRASDHNPYEGWVHAIDLDEDIAPGLNLWDFALRLQQEMRKDVAEGWVPRIRYWIYEGEIAKSYPSNGKPAGERHPYTGPNAHLHHLHISINRTHQARNDLRRWGFAGSTTPTPAPAPTPKETPTMFMMTCPGKPTRLVDGPTCPVIGIKTAIRAGAQGVITIEHEAADYDARVNHHVEALGRHIVAAIKAD